ncbi:amidohydrolase/deacetylase family metallohydrolase [Brevibacillus marinus]|uniref:amidohydrolase/deacetylase family metallohydrolase n=1 Tax=Brevibacillus marinus TaxID=2496837 RepID=UPI000F816F2E|nr:amidohydrolase/deacetylase family metallohydrolase [Brevibacillus marinus]
MESDLVITNGWIIDPSQQLAGRYDLTVAAGKITGIHQPGRRDLLRSARQVLDASGKIVTPGLIDLHTHVFVEETPLGIPADQVGVEQGVTTVVDAGSAGARSFARFVETAVQPSATQVLAYLNIAGAGLCEGLSELADIRKLAPGETAELIQSNPLIRGIKARMSGSVVKQSGIQPLLIAKQVAAEVNRPLMVHIGNAPPSLAEILALLEAGDVVTHAFHGKRGGILGCDGRLLPEVRAALRRGVRFDVGHGTSSFSFATMRRAKALGVAPYTISTDIYRQNVNGPVFSLATTMSKFLALGFSLTEVIAATTCAPAEILGLANEIGTLRPHTVADITVLQLTRKPITLIDSEQQRLTAEEALEPVYAIKSGKVMTCRC